MFNFTRTYKSMKFINSKNDFMTNELIFKNVIFSELSLEFKSQISI